MSISSDRVEAIFKDALYQDGDGKATDDAVIAEGVVHTVGFHPGRIESHRDEVVAMLSELPDEFRKDGGGGWSFLNACNDRHGEQWTGLHLRMEQLFQLGIGLGLVESLIPRDLWAALPGGVPYYALTLPAETPA